MNLKQMLVKMLASTVLLSVGAGEYVLAQGKQKTATVQASPEMLTFEAEDISSPQDAWAKDINPVDKWNLWTKDTDADKKWSGGMVLQSPRVLEDRQRPEQGAPMLHCVITDIPKGTYLVRIKSGRGLAASLDKEKWINLSRVGGRLGTFEIKDGRLEFWIDDRFAATTNPGSCYYDCVYLIPQMAFKSGVTNGDLEAGDRMPGSGWNWFSREKVGGAEFDPDAHGGKRCVKITHSGERDWALSNAGRLDVHPGQVWTVEAWVKCEDSDGVRLAVVALSQGKTLRWDIGSHGLFGTEDWTRLEATAFIPDGCDQVYVRFVGSGKCLAWADDIAIKKGPSTARREPKPAVRGWAKQRVTEKMGRGVVAVPTGNGGVYVGWRLLQNDPEDIAFNVYRSSGDGKPVKLNARPLTRTTDFVDSSPVPEKAGSYWVRPVVRRRELAPSERWPLKASPDAVPYISIKLNGEHTFQKVGIADLNGDGRYDYVIKQPGKNVDPYRLYWKKSPGTYRIEAYLHDGTFLWSRDLGWSIEQGIWYSPYVVYDFDGDGKAEIAVKTGEGDPRDKDGRVRQGVEYLAIWDGMTGKEIARVPWPSRKGFGSYNLSSRNQLAIAYLDGKTPCLLAARGTYTLMKLEAYSFHGGRLQQLWKWNSTEERSGNYRGQGAHFAHAADVDGDGRDEVILGSCIIDDNGQGLWSNGMGHCDHCYVSDIDPSRPGLEIYYGYETAQLRNGCCLADARTGEIIWGIDELTKHVHASGLCADFHPLYAGMECYSGEKEYPKDRPHRWLHTAQGKLLAKETTVDMGLSPRAVYWDADPQREILRGSSISNFLGGVITREIKNAGWTGSTWADILGDWREEIIVTVSGELRIYTTTIPASDRRVCLMQDPLYRLDVAHLAMGYAQPPMTSFYIGGQAATLELQTPSHARSGTPVQCKVVLVAPLQHGLAGTVKLQTARGVTVNPASVKLTVPAGEFGEAPFTVTIGDQRPVWGKARSARVRGTFKGGGTELECTVFIRMVAEPLSGVPLVQAEQFAQEQGGKVHIRKDKVGAFGTCFSHWDDKGHALTWKIRVPRRGQIPAGFALLHSAGRQTQYPG